MAKGLTPRLHIIAPTGATLTASFGGKTVNLTEVSSGIYEANVTKLGDWTVSGTLGNTTNSIVVSVNDVALAEGLLVLTSLDNTDWATISAVSAADMGANFWSVGDCKAVTLNGTCGTLALDTTLYCYIIEFDHNEALEGKGITFGTWKTAASEGVDVALVDSYYTTAESDGTKAFNMNHWGGSSSPYNTNYGGWKGCDLRYDILGSTMTAPSGYGSTATTSRVGYDAASTTATSPVSNTLMSCLPSALRTVMKPMTKYTDNVGNSSNTDAGISSSIDYLPLLAEWEIFGARTNANQYEKNYQAQYTYYSSGNSNVKYQHNATTTSLRWWERSPYYSGNNTFCIVGINGGAGTYASKNSLGLAPIFMV